MLRQLTTLAKLSRHTIIPKYTKLNGMQVMFYKNLADVEDTYKRFEAFFYRTDIGQWEVRKAINEAFADDYIPDPKVLIAMFRAIRRLNDFAMAVRLLEVIREKSPDKNVRGYLFQEIQPVLHELGINSLEEFGYNQPELWLERSYDIH